MKLTYRAQSSFLVFWVLIVTLLFKIIPDKQTAGVIAGVGFILLPSFFLFLEFVNEKSKIHIAVLALFLSCSALPIFLLRVFNWTADFKTLSILGVSTNTLHLMSNFIYILIIISAIFHWRQKK